MQKYNQLWRLLRRSQLSVSVLSLAVVLVLVDAASAVGFPYLTQLLVDNFGSQGIPWEIVTSLVLLLTLGSLSQGGAHYLLGRLGQQFVRKTRIRLHKKIINLPIDEFDKTRAAEPAGRLVSDTNVISGMVSQQVLIFVSGITTLIASLIILWFIDAVLTAVLFGCVLIAFLCILPLAGGMTKLSSDLQEGEANVIARLSEVFTHIRFLKSAGAQQQEQHIAADEVDYLYGKSLKVTKIMSFFGPIVSLAISTAMICILVVGATRVSEGAITLGALVAFILYLFNIVFPLAGLSTFVAELNKSSGAADRLSEIESIPVEVIEGESQSLKGQGICFNDLHFCYEGKSSPALSIDSLTLPPNSLTAVVGSSGAGKSTLFALLNRFYPSTGIEVAGMPIEKIALTEWRKQVATVAQNNPVLSGSVRFNLCYGQEDTPSDEVLVEILKDVQLWPFLQSQNGLDSLIGEHGTNVSGGQKQRLSIAWAMLRDPELLILDEATSALDSKTEQAVNDALMKMQQGRTCLVAAHRLNTVVNADQIVVLEKGQVVDIGNHKSLLKRSEHYRQLVEQQLLSDGNTLSEEVA